MKKILLVSFCSLFTLLCFAQGNIGIVGPAANGWPDPATNPTPDIMLTNNGDGTHFIAGLTLTTGAAKFRTDMDWGNPNYGGDTFPSGSITSNNIPVTAGVYDILLDLNNNTYSFTSVSGFTDIELAGTALDGAANPQMASTDGETYTLNAVNLISGDLQFREIGTTTVYGDAAFPSGTATSGGTINVPAGIYNITFNLNTLDYSFDYPVIGIVGPAVNGWPDAANPTPDVVFTTTDGDTYTLDNQVLLDDVMKFRQNRDWSANWGGSSFPSGTLEFNGNDLAATAGTYDIVFSRSNLTYAFNATASVEDENFAGFKVYPNPSSNVWVFKNQSMDIASIKVFDQLGKLVLESAPESFTAEVDSKIFKSGLYLAQIQLENGAQKTVKLFKN